ncbi:MAG: inositol monophosphatase, partial [Anaerolineae bacterium]|nr:inositol monophosphatase [Anaerolineae bacterium]
NIHRQVDLGAYPGKIRSIGSAALHLCFPLIYPGLLGALAGPGGHIWDIAGAHAVVRSLGFDFEYLDGERIDYGTLTDGRPLRDIVLAGSEQRRSELKKALVRL